MECQDNQTLIGALCRLWAEKPKGKGYDEPYFHWRESEWAGAGPAALAESV